METVAGSDFGSLQALGITRVVGFVEIEATRAEFRAAVENSCDFEGEIDGNGTRAELERGKGFWMKKILFHVEQMGHWGSCEGYIRRSWRAVVPRGTLQDA